MIDETKFTDWKTFAYVISEELDGLQKEDARNKEEIKKLKSEMSEQLDETLECSQLIKAEGDESVRSSLNQGKES